MKILRVIPSIDAAAGGPVTGLIASSYKLLALGHHIDVACLDLAGSEVVRSFTLPVYALGQSQSTYGRSKLLREWLTENVNRYDVVIIHGIWQYHTLAAANACRRNNVPYVVFTHGMLDPWFKKTYPLKHLKKLAYWFVFLRKILKHAQGVIFTTDEERRLAAQSFPVYSCKEYVVNYGITDPVKNIVENKKIFFEKYPDLVDKKIYLFLSRIHPKKGLDILIEAFAKVVENDPNTCLVIAGPDESGMQESLEKMVANFGIQNHVIFTGILKGNMKWGAFAAADCFVLPSHQENFGIAVAEALSAELPVLITDKVNIYREILADNAGFAKSDNVEDFTAVLRMWGRLSATDKFIMRQNARKSFLMRFEITEAALSLEKVLKDATS